MKSVLITGCSSGFGRGMVDEFLHRGWLVFATLRQADQRRELLAEPLAQYGDRLHILNLDVTDPAQRAAVVEVIQQQGQLDCLVNNAGHACFGPLEDFSEDQIQQQLAVNLEAPALLTRSLLPYLRQAQGKLIFVSSVFGFTGFPLSAVYCASKYALEGLAESLYYELEPHGVQVALIEPGASKTHFGKNLTWAVGNTDAYQQQISNYHQFKERLSARTQTNTALVARKVADLVEGRSRQFRVQVGRDAVLSYQYQRLVPDRLRLGLSNLFYRRLFLRKPSL